MTDEDALLAAVLATPADDTARVVLADWYEEHGSRPDRAAFIRRQVANPGEKYTCARPDAISPDVEEVLGELWLLPSSTPYPTEFTVRRGWAEAVA